MSDLSEKTDEELHELLTRLAKKGLANVSDTEYEEGADAQHILETRSEAREYPKENGFYWYYDAEPGVEPPFGYGQWYIVGVVKGDVLVPGVDVFHRIAVPAKHYGAVARGHWGPKVKLPAYLAEAHHAK